MSWILQTGCLQAAPEIERVGPSLVMTTGTTNTTGGFPTSFSLTTVAGNGETGSYADGPGKHRRSSMNRMASRRRRNRERLCLGRKLKYYGGGLGGIRRIDPQGNVSTLSINGMTCGAGGAWNGPPSGLAIGGASSLYVSAGSCVFKVDLESLQATTLAGSGDFAPGPVAVDAVGTSSSATAFYSARSIAKET